MSSSSQSSEAEEEKIQEKPKVQKQQRSPTERPWKHRKKSQKESLEEKKAVLEEKIAKEKQAGLAGSRFKIKRSSIDLGRRHVAISGQKDHPAKIEEQGSQGSESAATVVERSTQAPVQPPTNGGGMSINEWRRFSKGGSSLEFPPNIEFYRNTLEKLESGEGRLPPTRPSMMDLVEGLKNRQKEAHRDSLFSLELFKEQNTEIIEGQQRILGKLRSQPRRSESGSSKKSMSIQKQHEQSTNISGPPTSTSKTMTKFGWIEGVLIRCMASIFGVMLYLRLSWVAGQAGILFGSFVVLLGTLITVITTLSTSAICTNGLVKGGGAYFLISRSLGPEFGGSIGVIFSIANAVGAAMYLVGFAETIRDLLKSNDIYLLDGEINDIRIIALIACALIIIVILVGLSFESKMQIILMVLLWLSIFDYWIGTFLSPSEDQQKKGIVGYKLETIKENFMPSFRDGYDFFSVFAVYFPAATGIMAGANISGDLKDPQKAIPLGTLVAIGITTFVYLIMVWMTGSTTLRDADGIHIPHLLSLTFNASKELVESTSVSIAASNATDNLLSSTHYYAPPQCYLTHNCSYGLFNYFQIVELGSALGPLVTIGIIASTLSSALVSMVGAPKIFQAVCRDRLFPYINRFGRGHGPNEEPRQALFLAGLIAVSVILIGDLNMIAPLISNFFLCSYALINYACFDNSFAHSPGFRPSFKFYNKWVSLAGSLMCVFCMFIISWWTALLTFFFFIAIYIYVAHRKPEVNWGSSAQAHSYRNALQYVSKLERTEEHVKNYRPQILVLSGNPASRAGLVDFAYSITKGNGLLTCGYIIPYKPCNTVFTMLQNFNQQLRDWFVSRHLKGTFAVTVANPNLRAGAQTLLQIAGLGKLRPNIVLMGYKQNWAQNRSPEGINKMIDYFGMIQDAFDLNMSVGVLRNSNRGFDISELILETGEELRLHLKQRGDTLSTRSYPLESHPHQSQSISQQPSVHTCSSPQLGITSFSINPRQKARDLFLRSISKEQRTFDGKSAQSGDTMQTTLGGDTTYSPFTITPVSSCSATLKSKKFGGGGLRKLLGASKSNVGEDVEQSKEDVDQSLSSEFQALPLPSDTFRFQTRVRQGTIDVWWLYDDGGLTLLIPYLLTKKGSYLEGAKLRVFTLAGVGKNLQQEQQSLATMLRKFRISADQVNVIPDFTSKKPDQKSLAKFEKLIDPLVLRSSRSEEFATSSSVTVSLGDGEDEKEENKIQYDDEQQFRGLITETELDAQRERTWRQLRIAELLKRYSSGSDLIVVTLPVPRRGLISPALYLAWLEMMSSDLPPTLLLRGNQQSVLTFYS
ncbi:hypothetical protein ACQ4LE_005539 [Meloidogyne hapla]